MIKAFTYSFFIKKDKISRSGAVPIFLKIRCNGTETTLATPHKISLLRWQQSTQLKLARKEEDKRVKGELDKIIEKLQKNAGKMREVKIPLTAKILKESLDSHDQNLCNGRTLLGIYDSHNAQYARLVEIGEKSHGSLVKHRTVRKHLANFIEREFKVDDILLTDLNLHFIEKFDLYLRTIVLIGNNTTVKDVRCCRKITNQAVKYGWLTIDPFKGYDKKLREVDVEFLTDEELAAIENKSFTSARLDHVRDVFLFTCYTGYAPIDVCKLTVDDVKKNSDGEQWIFTKRTKTRSRSDVLLLPKALELIKKYDTHSVRQATGKLFPTSSSQKTNEYLKEIAVLCKIEKKLHHYVARHTFATTVTLAKGVSLEVVSKMMGHKSLKQTQHYAKILDSRVSQEMRALKAKYEVKTVDL